MAPNPWILLTAVLLPVVAGLLTLALPRKAVSPRVLLALLGPAASFVLVCLHLRVYPASEATATTAAAWVPLIHLNLAFLADGLGAFFALLVAGVGVLIVLYARAYFGGTTDPARDDLYRFYPTLGFFTTAMLGLVLADATLLTLVFWELTSISSFLLIGWDRYDKQAVKLAMQAFFTTGFGGMILLGGLLVLGNATGLWRWSELAAAAAQGELVFSRGVMWAFVLMFVGAASKSAQVPFHYWLPGAMAAPTPVSAFLHSATMVKAGVYLVGRLFPILAALDLWPMLVLPVGAATMLLGACIALNQHDLKRIFAYTTVSQLGLLMAMYGLGAFSYHGQPNLDFDITQIANHAFYKAPLFILAGALGHMVSRDITELSGAARKVPILAVLTILAAYALAALPGSISFQAKELFLYAIVHSQDTIGQWWVVLMAMAVVTSVCNVAIFVRLTTTLLGLPGGMKPSHTAEKADVEAHDESHLNVDPDMHAPGFHEEDKGHAHHEHVHERGFWPMFLWVPAAVLLLFQFVGGLYTPLWNRLFAGFETLAAGHYIGESYGGVPALWQVQAGVPLLGSVAAVAGGLAVGLSPWFRGAITDVADRIYPAIYKLVVRGGFRAFHLLQSGHQRHYVLVVLAVAVGGLGLAYAAEPGMADAVADAWGRRRWYWPGIFLGGLVCGTAVLIPMVRDRLLRVMLLSGCGFATVTIYLVYQAPDLALTQLMFEIISVVLFVLALRLLPPDTSPTPRPLRLGLRLIASMSVGLMFGLMTLVAAGGEPAERLGEFFLRNSYMLEGTEVYGGGGKNVVNVILVDFRGFDTFGEITVLGITALGVWSILPSRKSRRSS